MEQQKLYGIPVRLPEERVAGCCCRMPGAARVVAITESVLIAFAAVGIAFVFISRGEAGVVNGCVGIGVTLLDLMCVVCLFKAVRLRSPANTLPYIIWKSIQTSLMILGLSFSVYSLVQLRRHVQNYGGGDANEAGVEDEDAYFTIKTEHEEATQSTGVPHDLPDLTLITGLYLGATAGYILLQIAFLHIVVQVRHYLLRQPNAPIMYPSQANHNESINGAGGYTNVIEPDEEESSKQDLVKFQIATYEFQAPPPAYDLQFRKQ